MTLEIRTPLLRLGSDVLMELIQLSTEQKADVRATPKLTRFIDALTKSVPSYMAGRPDAKKFEQAKRRYAELPLWAQIYVVDKARTSGCAEDLARIVGELPSGDSVTERRRPPDPMWTD